MAVYYPGFPESMSLIVLAFVVRVRDGLPLSASTDFHHNQELQQCKQQLKTISKALTLWPGRATVRGQELNIQNRLSLSFASSEGVSYMAVCSSKLASTTAFCFLEELRWAFSACFDCSTVALATRPYPFLEFDTVIQKMKLHYSLNGGPCPGTNLAELQEDLRTTPPKILSLDEMEQSNGVANGPTEPVSGSGMNQRLEPVTAPGILSLVLNIMCAALNLIRGIHLIEYTFQDDYEGIWNVAAFLLAFTCCLTQCHLYLFYTLQKKLKSFALLAVIVLCNIFLYGLRNLWQVVFHVAVGSLSTYLILSRKPLEKTLDCGV